MKKINDWQKNEEQKHELTRGNQVIVVHDFEVQFRMVVRLRPDLWDLLVTWDHLLQVAS